MFLSSDGSSKHFVSFVWRSRLYFKYLPPHPPSLPFPLLPLPLLHAVKHIHRPVSSTTGGSQLGGPFVGSFLMEEVEGSSSAMALFLGDAAVETIQLCPTFLPWQSFHNTHKPTSVARYSPPSKVHEKKRVCCAQRRVGESTPTWHCQAHESCFAITRRMNKEWERKGNLLYSRSS